MRCRENDAQVRARLTIQPLSRAFALAVVQAISLKNCGGNFEWLDPVEPHDEPLLTIFYRRISPAAAKNPGAD